MLLINWFQYNFRILSRIRDIFLSTLFLHFISFFCINFWLFKSFSWFLSFFSLLIYERVRYFFYWYFQPILLDNFWRRHAFYWVFFVMNIITRLISFNYSFITIFIIFETFFWRLTLVNCFLRKYSAMLDFAFYFKFNCCLLNLILINFICYSYHVYSRSCFTMSRRIFIIFMLAKNFYRFLWSYMRSLMVKNITLLSRPRYRL